MKGWTKVKVSERWWLLWCDHCCFCYTPKSFIVGLKKGNEEIGSGIPEGLTDECAEKLGRNWDSAGIIYSLSLVPLYKLWLSFLYSGQQSFRGEKLFICCYS